MDEHPFSSYLDAQPEPQRTTLLEIAARLRKILPAAQECMSYGVPAFQVDGTSIAGFAGLKNHCSYFPHSGSLFERIESQVAAYDHDKGTLRFAIDRPLPLALLRTLVVVRLQIETEKSVRSGKVRTFYDNGFVKAKGATRNGAMHGPWAWWRKDGSLMRTGHFKLGDQVGVWRTFDRSGRLVKETTF